MPKLNECVAVEQVKKKKKEETVNKAYQILQKADLLSGLSRVYRPKDEEGDELPPESQRLQVKVSDVLDAIMKPVADLIDITSTKNKTNGIATADVTVDGKTILEEADPPTLLFLEKLLVDLHTFFKSIPVLAPEEEWEFDSGQNCFRTGVKRTTRTKKIPMSKIVAEATEHHPAQVQTWGEDVIVGMWEAIKYSGCIEQSVKDQMVNRVETLQIAVKAARERANTCEVHRVEYGMEMLDYIINGV